MDVIWPLFVLVIIKFLTQKEKRWMLRFATMIIPALILTALMLLKRNYFSISWLYNICTISCFFLLAASFHLIKNSIKSILEVVLIFLCVDFFISISLTCFVFDKITFQKFMNHIWLIIFTSLFYGSSNFVILITLQKHQSYKNRIHH